MVKHGGVYIADWDESDAFCNIPREDAPALLEDIAPGLARWMQSFYGRLSIRTITPHGLTDPFRMLHGGGQGDSGGVGAYLAVGIQRTRCHWGTVLLNMDPRRPGDRLRRPADPPLASPFDPLRPVLEIVYSDDRRPVASTQRGLELLLNAMAHACWAAGGSVNTTKLQAFHVILQGGRLRYAGGNLYPSIGRIPLRRGGLLLAGIPLLMGERLPGLAKKVEKRLQLVHAGVLRLQPSFTLALRIILGYVVSQLDYVHAACPPAAAALQPLQTKVDMILLHAQCRACLGF